jgi:hypothetical protein
MSENLDLVHAIYAAWELGDFSSAEWADPTIEFEIADGPDPTKAIGIPAMAKTWSDQLRMWNDYRVGPQEYRELDAERVLVCVHNSGRAKASGLELGELMGTTHGANLLVLRNSKVVRFVLYFDRELAFAELGLGVEGA